MIRINLLPEEYRKKARTPVKLLVALGVAVLVNAGLLTYWGYQSFGIQAEIDGQAASLQTEMDGLTPQVTYYNSLDAESKQYKSRESTLANITASRVSWTKKLDEFIDVVNRGGNGQRHMVWFDDLTVSASSDPKAKSAGSFKSNGHSGSDKFAQVANFLEDLETSTFVSDFRPPSPPEGTQTLVDETLVPSVAWSFPLSLTMKTAEERGADKAATDKNKGKAPAKPAPQGAKANAPTAPAGESNGATGAQEAKK